MNVLPTTSSEAIYLRIGEYDLAQLVKAMKATKSGARAKPAPIPDEHMHLHTLHLQATLQPEPEVVEYPDGIRVNDSFPVWHDFRQSVHDSVEACVPLSFFPPTADIIHIPASRPIREKKTLANRCAFVHRPTFKSKPLIKIPDICTGSDARRQFFPSTTAWDHLNWIHAALSLDPDEPPCRAGKYRPDDKRVFLRTGVDVSWTPDDSGDEDECSITLSIAIDVYLDMSVVLLPQPDVANDLLGLVLVSLLPADLGDQPHPSREGLGAARADALKAFYAALKPASDLPYGFDARKLQPSAMTKNLLPFQKRSVARLLEREGSPMVTGNKAFTYPEGQWVKYDFGKFGNYAFHRLTSQLVKLPSDRKGKRRADDTSWEDALDHVFPLSKVRGTMLCEEMGLGKTVEAIALVLLHPHPLSHDRLLNTVATIDSENRLPEINLEKKPDFGPIVGEWVKSQSEAFAGSVSWSEEAQINVAAVGTTLIVTPQSLLNQWVSEMKLHAPSLRVCVYPGWTDLLKQVEKRRKTSVHQKRRQAAQNLKRQRVKFRNATRRKYAKGADGAKLEIESESEEEYVSEYNSDDEESEVITPKSEDGETLLDVTQQAFLEYIRGFDIVITTYQTLSTDLNVADPAPRRSRRSTANYRLNERPRSPLVMVEWWRVIMDEVQLQGDSSTAAQMVSKIPRQCSLAMSGTPARSSISDLQGSLKFLHVPVASSVIWSRITQPSNRSAFEGLFKAISVRTTKAEVVGEFNLPNQTRYVIPIELSDIEMHYYLDVLERQRDRLGLTEGRQRDQDLDFSTYRMALRHLRQICTHIQVGGFANNPRAANQRADRIQLGRQLMTMDEALKKMRDDLEENFILLTRTLYRAQLDKAQLLVRDESDDLRNLKALAIYERVREGALKLLEEAKAELSRQAEGREDSVDDEGHKDESQAEKTKRLQISGARTSVRETMNILHLTWFLQGDVHHTQKEEDLEVLAYQNAENMRREILARPLKAAERVVQSMSSSLSDHAAIRSLSELQTKDTRRGGGILSGDLISQANSLLKILNDNAVLVYNWRNKVVELLEQPIEAKEETVPGVGEGQDVENPDQEYYAEALKSQGDLDAYLTAYAAAIADRKEMLLEERTLLAVHDAHITKKRSTANSKDAEVIIDPDLPTDVQDLTIKLLMERNAFRERRTDEECERPLKALLVDLGNIVHAVGKPEESAVAKEAATMLRAYIKSQTEIVEKLNKELDLLRDTHNGRLKYFAALQEISDSVAVPKFKDVRKEIEAKDRQIMDAETTLARWSIRRRYLGFLDAENQNAGDLKENCAICFGTSDDTHAVLLHCGHMFCVSCYTEYRKSPFIGRKCANCKAVVDDKAIQRVRIRAPEAGEGEGEESSSKIEIDPEPVLEEPAADKAEEVREAERRAADLDKLNMLPPERMRPVSNIDMMGEFGSKINFLVKHLHYYRLTQPSTRHVVFSNWADSLRIVERALSVNHIRYVSLDANSKRNDVVHQFQNDNSITVFLLHAERESAGLTLTAASVVHLLEPIMQHSFELQAIGRVDRLGQEKQTTVYCYATMDTVESRILSQGVRNGTSIYLNDKDEDEKVAAALPNVPHAAERGGDTTLGETGIAELLRLII